MTKKNLGILNTFSNKKDLDISFDKKKVSSLLWKKSWNCLFGVTKKKFSFSALKETCGQWEHMRNDLLISQQILPQKKQRSLLDIIKLSSFSISLTLTHPPKKKYENDN